MPTKLAKRTDFVGTGPVRYRLEGPPEAPTSASIAVDYSEAPVPEHYYVADYFEVANLDPQVLFIFGKLNHPRQDQLRNKLEIYFPAIFFVQQLWKSSREFHQTLRTFVQQHGYKRADAGALAGTTEKVQTQHSNNVLIALSGGECMMDFFYLSPRDVTINIRKRQNIHLEALVRVISPPTVLLGFLDACEPIADALVPKFGGKGETNEILEL